jgi:hypothetical protein
MNELFDYSLRDFDPSDMVGISIHNADNHNYRPNGLSFRRRDQVSRDVLWSLFEVTQSNARFLDPDILTFHVHSAKMPVGLGKRADTLKGTSLPVMAHVMKSMVEVKAEKNCLAHALVFIMARASNDPD